VRVVEPGDKGAGHRRQSGVAGGDQARRLCRWPATRWGAWIECRRRTPEAADRLGLDTVPGIPEATHPAIKVRAITTAATAIALGRMVRPSEHRPRPRRSGGQTIAASCRAASHDGPIRLENASITAA
jgi:hypothetical protein